MKVVMEHKLNDDQKDEFKAEFERGLEDLKVKMDSMLGSWEKTKRVATYAIVTSGVVGFVLGYAIGKQR